MCECERAVEVITVQCSAITEQLLPHHGRPGNKLVGIANMGDFRGDDSCCADSDVVTWTCLRTRLLLGATRLRVV